jgi:hypothetical protein
MPSDDQLDPQGSLARQRAHRRGWRRRLLLVLAIVIVASGGAYAIAGPLRPDDKQAASPPRSTNSTGPAEPAGVAQACRSPLNPPNPLRLWIGGDSLAGSLGPSLGEVTGTSGVVQPVVDSRVSSGLSSPNFVDWPKQGAEDMLTYNPEVTVFIIGANDAKNLPKGAEQDQQWRTQYAAAVEKMLGVLVGPGRNVYWVGAPIMSDAAFSERVKSVNEVFEEVAAKHPEVTYVDAFAVFSGPDGKFTSMLPSGDGKVTRVRAQDGIHFTPEGGDLLARTVLERLDPQCQIMQQAVRGVVKRTIEAKGSSSVAGTRRESSSRSTSGPRLPAPAESG